MSKPESIDTEHNNAFQTAYDKVKVLVEQFKEHEALLLSDKYQESQVRTDYLDKFFIALGWDVRHKYQTNPREQEVQIESNSDSLSSRKVDYAFFLQPDYQRPVFLVEAKKPRHDLTNADYYFQTIRYGYNRGTSISILTDFQEFHIIDCRRKPQNVAGLVNYAQLKKYTYTDYLDLKKFGEIYWLFSREAVEQNKLKEFWKALPKPKGISKQLKLIKGDQLAPPDDEFLADLDEYRKQLAKALYKTNPTLPAEELTASVQAVLDRLVFIRFLEDKQIEPDFIVDRFLQEGASWLNFMAWSKKLDKKYNGIVFKQHYIDKPECHPPDDGVFFDVCESLSAKESPYLLNYIPVEILGSIYERFLGKVIVKKGRGVVVEEKPEVRKAGGVYYTPKYIVDYIVANTVGKILRGSDASPIKKDVSPLNKGGDTEGGASSGVTPQPPLKRGVSLDVSSKGGAGLTPKQVAKLRFADIACGSGSFLIAIFEHVKDYLEAWYNEHPADAEKDKCTKAAGGRWALSFSQKRDILKNNIFGVDLDRQAVEVAQFSLFLKLLESESIATTETYQTELIQSVDKQILPDLSKNILCGNSLVERDIETLFPLSIEDELHIRPFNFEVAFKDIMQSGGFDAIVGNPPYVRTEGLDQTILSYFHHKYSFSGQLDLYLLFIVRSLNLLKKEGYFSYITPKFLWFNIDAEFSRLRLLDNNLVLLTDVGKAFENVNTECAVTTAIKQTSTQTVQSEVLDPDGVTIWRNVAKVTNFKVLPYNIFNIYITDEILAVINKMKEGTHSLSEFIDMKRGMELGKSYIRSIESGLPALLGEEVNQFSVRYGGTFVDVNNKEVKRLKEFSEKSPKLLIRRVSPNLISTVDYEPRYFTKNLYGGVNKSTYALEYLVGILNSKSANFFFKKYFTTKKVDIFPEFQSYQLLGIPIPSLDLTNKTEKSRHDKLVSLVEQMLAAKKRLGEQIFDSERHALESKCEYLDAEIDKLVYGLYGLTEEEIRVVEGR